MSCLSYLCLLLYSGLPTHLSDLSKVPILNEQLKCKKNHNAIELI